MDTPFGAVSNHHFVLVTGGVEFGSICAGQLDPFVAKELLLPGLISQNLL